MRIPLFSCLFLVAACHADPPAPLPLVEQVRPGVVCNQQLTKTVQLGGENLSPTQSVRLTRTAGLDGTGQSGAAVMAGGVAWKSEQLLTFQVEPALALEIGLHDVAVIDRDGRVDSATWALAVVPPPEVSAVTPAELADPRLAQALTVRGAGIVAVGERFPQVELLDAAGQPLLALPGEPTDCTILPMRETIVTTCRTLPVTVPAGALPPGRYAVRVTNPADAACHSTEMISLMVAATP